MNKTIKNIIFIGIILLINACSFSSSRYQQHHDSTPSRIPTAQELTDATFRIENKSRGGNKNYTVRGIHYDVLTNAQGYKATGIASYYGNKFHGHLTSNGEIYNMFSMSAAHKSLPLPTYLKVTNIENNKSVIVRVNDRGPFHQDRLIDLSYSAAYKLDFLKNGTAQVKIAAITEHKSASAKIVLSTATSNNKKHLQESYFIQVFATNNKTKAKNTASALTALYQIPVLWPQQNGLFRVQIGPITDLKKVNALLNNLQLNGYPKAFRRKSNS
ncbi:MAG: septal ring lytic transglycosylase RlpA [Gammaproteobacteria bacterium]|nr:MAG: septal ring lytic transglycosylase RlpA [Gammaproteobacteria bacterium]